MSRAILGVNATEHLKRLRERGRTVVHTSTIENSHMLAIIDKGLTDCHKPLTVSTTLGGEHTILVTPLHDPIKHKTRD